MQIFSSFFTHSGYCYCNPWSFEGFDWDGCMPPYGGIFCGKLNRQLLLILFAIYHIFFIVFDGLLLDASYSVILYWGGK